MSNAEIKSFRNTIEEGSISGSLETATTLLTMEIEIKCGGLDHATKVCKQITAAVEKALTPEHMDGMGV